MSVKPSLMKSLFISTSLSEQLCEQVLRDSSDQMFCVVAVVSSGAEPPQKTVWSTGGSSRRRPVCRASRSPSLLLMKTRRKRRSWSWWPPTPWASAASPLTNRAWPRSRRPSPNASSLSSPSLRCLESSSTEAHVCPGMWCFTACSSFCLCCFICSRLRDWSLAAVFLFQYLFLVHMWACARSFSPCLYRMNAVFFCDTKASRIKCKLTQFHFKVFPCPV